MINLKLNTLEEIEELSESMHRSLKVYWGRASKGDKVAARKWKLLAGLRDNLIDEQLSPIDDLLEDA
jgi:hypothetical protein